MFADDGPIKVGFGGSSRVGLSLLTRKHHALRASWETFNTIVTRALLLGSSLSLEGWLRFDLDAAAPTTGTADYLPVPDENIFGCAATSAKVAVDEASRVVTLTFPPPCVTFELQVEPTTCGSGPKDATLWTGFTITDTSTGLSSTEGLLARFPGGHCDAAFTQCTF